MHITYNPEHNIGYIQFKKLDGSVAETLKVSGDLNVDMASDGTIYGIELLNANEQLKGMTSSVIIENQQSNQRQEMSL